MPHAVPGEVSICNLASVPGLATEVTETTVIVSAAAITDVERVMRRTASRVRLSDLVTGHPFVRSLLTQGVLLPRIENLP